MLYRPIAVFDSGLGSLSVVRELRKLLPTENILYFADKKNFPYGKKSKIELKEIMIRSISFLEKYQPKLIVMASNTPSIQIFGEIRDKFSVDIIPTLPPLQKSAQYTQKKHIGIMATSGTLNSKEFKYLLNKQIPQQIFITSIDSSDIISLVEDGSFLFDKSLTYDTIKKIVNPNIDDSIDVIVLASTHLPIVNNYLTSLMPFMKFLDSAIQVAKDTKNHLKFLKDVNKSGNGKLEVLVSAEKKEFQTILRYMGIKETITDVSLQFN